MRAWHDRLTLEEVRVDEPGPREVLVRTVASGICHSDLHVIEASLPVPPPCILGHEPAGIVEAVGAGVADVAPGDRVIGCLTQWCGVDFYLDGRLDLDAMISSRIQFDEVNDAFDRMRRGDAARQVIVFE